MPAVTRVARLTSRGNVATRETQSMRYVAEVDLRQLAHDLALASGTTPRAMARRVVKDAATQTVQLAQMLAPKKTGELRSSIKATYEQDGLVAYISPDTPYASYVEFGTGLHNELLPQGSRRPYIIEPKDPNGALRFVTGGGDVVFTRRVIHPGIKAQPYMRPAAERVADSFVRGMGDVGVKVLVEGDR